MSGRLPLSVVSAESSAFHISSASTKTACKPGAVVQMRVDSPSISRWFRYTDRDFGPVCLSVCPAGVASLCCWGTTRAGSAC